MAVLTRSMCKRKRKEDADFETNKTRIDDLNDTLLELIFTKLSPWKSLVISKCVSKRWNSIISNPDFTRQLTPPSLPFTLILSDERCVVTEHPYFQKHQYYPLTFITTTFHRFLANNDDLIVAFITNLREKSHYCIANPLTKQYVVVPLSLDPDICRYDHDMVGIAGFVDGVSTTNVSRSNNHNHGFRIIRFFTKNSKFTFQIYSSETGQWKTYLFDRIDCSLWRSSQAITWKNKLHWMEESQILIIDPFNIDNVAPKVLNLPDEIGNRSSVLGVCQNRLRIAQFEEPNLVTKNQWIQIWEVEDSNYVNGNLVQLKCVKDFELTRSFVECAGILSYKPINKHKMVCCHPNDPQVVYFFYDKKIFYCNLVDKKCKIMGYGSCYSGFVFVHPP